MGDVNDTRPWNDEPEEGYDVTGEREFWYVSYTWRGEAHRADTARHTLAEAQTLARELVADGWVSVAIVRCR